MMTETQRAALATLAAAGDDGIWTNTPTYGEYRVLCSLIDAELARMEPRAQDGSYIVITAAGRAALTERDDA